jgi:outer membrane lipoprotein-sorting protein
VSIRALKIASRLFAGLIAASALSSFASAQQPDVNGIVEKMVQAQAANRERLKAYMLTRTYQVFGGNEEKAKSTVTAEVSYVPPQQKDFKIQQSTGGMAERVVRKALEHEVKMTKDPQVGEITPQNYNFEYVGTQAIWGNNCFVFEIKPKRDSKELLKGRVWIDAERFLIRRVEGKPAKDPSWWVNDVRVTVTYDEVAGMWMQTGTDARAKVRFAGTYRLVSKDNEVRTAQSVAGAKNDSNMKRIRRAIVPAVAVAR